MNFIGDVHAGFNEYLALTNKYQRTFQVGDMGIGFHVPDEVKLKSVNMHHVFIHGNHDNPARCYEYPGYLGRYGHYSVNQVADTWYCSGGYSIDKRLRTPGVDWWEDEELSYDEMTKALSSYAGQPIVVTHDCPYQLYRILGIHRGTRSITNQAFNVLMSNKVLPKIWIFGHHHKTLTFWRNSVQFVCLGELAVAEVTKDYTVKIYEK